jgi:hypothetical protein
MDLLTAERLNGRPWNCAKYGALVCFLVAGALFAASLFLPPPAHVGNSRAETSTPPASGVATPTR